MALLNLGTPLRSRGPLLAAILLAVFAGCVLVDALRGEKPFAFSHRVHVVQEELECADCHRGGTTSDEPGMPALSQCMLCHKAIDEKKPPGRQVASLYVGKEYQGAHAAELGHEIVFSHKQHTGQVKDCDACHVGIKENEVVDRHQAVTMDACNRCHDERNVKGGRDCAVCHKEIRADRKPETHQPLWLRAHGRTVRAHSEETNDRCSLCHDDSSCESCHLAEPPENHNIYFRRRGHGVMARMDRDQCAACHRPDGCDACHNEARPLNHVGGWGSPTDNHCRTCHEPLRNSECSTCHKSAPSHGLAAPKPPGHVPSMNCRQCHGVGVRLPHFDNGDDCNSCHR